ncbi:choice-of-anchor J domain-containing protein [Mariniflexile ostreae]|uniref:Choice-of-anchor J domain-containing protein n=1 Tax=Mariniflexile ostreae TaxID=1520892 RepID=A0ABV5FE80_9FLAO
MAQEVQLLACGTETDTESITYRHTYPSQIKSFEDEYWRLTTQSKKTSAKKNNATPAINSIPIKAHIITATNGTGGLDTATLHSAIDTLNDIYASAFLEFFICEDINYINQDDLYFNFEKSKESDLIKNHFTSGVINLYFTKYVEISNGNSLCGYSNTFGSPDIIVMKNACVTNGITLAHEMGHFFSLLHTHGPSSTKLTTELADGSNCDTDGDQICDTPADPLLDFCNVDRDCTYTGTITDANGDAFTPDTSNIMSYSTHSCKSHFSPQQLARIYAFYKSARNYLKCPSYHVDIHANSTQECGGSLTVQFTDTSFGAVAWSWDVDGDGLEDYTIQNPTHTYTSGIYDVTLTISKASGFRKKESDTKDIKACPETKTITKTFPQYIKVGAIDGLSLNETFDNFKMASDYGWTAIDVSGNGYNWYSNSGQTVSNGTGPAVDHTKQTASGTYIYAEASGALAGDVATFVSPCMTIHSHNAKLRFNYHMFGKNTGSLHVDIETSTGLYIKDVIPAIYGEQQKEQHEAYRTQVVDLSAYANKNIVIHFRAIRGAGWDGDIAIDDVSITDDIYVEDDTENIKIYPNPVTGDKLYVNTEDVVDFRITNLVGQVFKKGQLDNQAIDISYLSPGSYFLVLQNKKSKTVKQFIKS